MKKVFDSDGLITTSVEYDETEGLTIFGSHQNVAPILEDVAARDTDGTAGYGKSRDFRHVARIPLALMDEWMREAQIQGIPIYIKAVKDEFIRKKLADMSKLKISGKANGRVGFGDGYGNQQRAAPMLKA